LNLLNILKDKGEHHCTVMAVSPFQTEKRKKNKKKNKKQQK